MAQPSLIIGVRVLPTVLADPSTGRREQTKSTSTTGGSLPFPDRTVKRNPGRRFQNEFFTQREHSEADNNVNGRLGILDVPDNARKSRKKDHDGDVKLVYLSSAKRSEP